MPESSFTYRMNLRRRYDPPLHPLSATLAHLCLTRVSDGEAGITDLEGEVRSLIINLQQKMELIKLFPSDSGGRRTKIRPGYCCVT